MKAFLTYDPSGDITSVAFLTNDVAADVDLEPGEPGEHVIRLDLSDIDPKADSSTLDPKRLDEYAKRITKDFRVASGKIARR
jgi:hypothetical protein